MVVLGAIEAGQAMVNGVVLFSSSRRNGNTGKLVDRIAGDLGVEVLICRRSACRLAITSIEIVMTTLSP